ncbi:SPT2 chromatin protein-domain-containing protein [Scleroderma yunnanense]
MSGFAALMALSASQTKETQSAVQSALLQRQRNEEVKRKKQEELERKEREEQAKIRQKRFEDEKKQHELEAKRAAEMQRLQAEKARREEEARNALLYGPKKSKYGSKWPTSNGTAKEDVRKRRLPSDDDDDSRCGSPAMALTREEKRRRRLDAEMRRTYAIKRSSTSSGYTKAGRRLPGGAIDATSAPSADSGASTQSVKARLAALPNTLTKLNVNKRDTRTIDEILQDRAKAKHGILDGDEAREFNDWFGKSKKKDIGLSSAPSSSSQVSPPPSGAASPLSSSATGISAKMASDSRSASVSAGARPVQSKTPASVKPQPSKSLSTSRPSNGSVPSKKRARSPSCSESPPPKRRADSPADAIRSEIWKLFGKDRTTYVARDIDSDDDDMEADASALMKEELRSARLAKREDELALLEEKRHEDEKRRRKREREMKEKRG